MSIVAKSCVSPQAAGPWPSWEGRVQALFCRQDRWSTIVSIINPTHPPPSFSRLKILYNNFLLKSHNLDCNGVWFARFGERGL